METNNHLFPWLELMDQPAFCIKNGAVVAVNSAASRIMLREDMKIQEIVPENYQAYQQLHNGTLFLNITVGGQTFSACVNHTEEYDIFVIKECEEDIQLQALSLAAQQLRIPLSNMMSAADTLFSNLDQSDSTVQQHTGQMNRSLFQLMRIISNMSDVKTYKNAINCEKQNVNLTALFDEIIEKIQTVSESTKKKVAYTGFNSVIIGLINEEQIGRAVYNLLANALKFSPAESTIEANLTKSGNSLSFTVRNATEEPVTDYAFWNRYHRKPSIEDAGYGLGLGMTLISSVACAHGGTVLIDHPTPTETRITMTIPIVKSESNDVRSPVFRIGDYAGGWDKGLLELSEILPADSYENIN